MRRLVLVCAAALLCAGAAHARSATPLLSALRDARQATHACQQRLGERALAVAEFTPSGHLYRRWVLTLWVRREAACEKRLRDRTIPTTGDWQTAARIAQRAYPGTESWLLSCSDAEGGHGRWVWHGGRSWSGYHIGYDSTGDTVGGWMQFRWSTFQPYWRRAEADLRARGYVIPDLGGGYGPWLSPLGQALTAGYMRYRGLDGSHWSASWGRGC